MNFARFIISLATVFTCEGLYAQSDTAGPELKYHLEEVSISAPLLHRKLITAPSSISQLNNKSLTLNNAFSYVEQLEQIPGITAQAGTYSTVRIAIRGIGSRTPYGTNRIKAYLNNIPLTTGEGYSQIEDIDPVFLQSVFVIKGAKSALYGSGLGGIMMLDTRENTAEGVHFTAGLEYGSYNTLHPYLLLNHTNKKVCSTIGYSLLSADGWRENNRVDRHNLFASLKHSGKQSTTNLILYYIDNYAQIPSSLNEIMFNNSPEKAAPNWLAVGGFEDYKRLLTGINHVHTIRSRWKVDIGLSLSLQNGYESRPFNILDDNSIHLTQKSLLSYRVNNLTIRGGYEFQSETYNWQIFETQQGLQGELQRDFKENRYPLSLFLQSELRLGTTIIEGGISYNLLEYSIGDNYSDTIDLSGHYRFDPVISPFLGLNIPIGSTLRLFTSVGHGISYPDVEETLLSDYTINTNLKPETGINLEAGVRGRLIDNALFFDLSLYRMQVRNLLVIKRESEDVFYAENAGKSIHRGIEIYLNYLLTKQAIKHTPQTEIFLAANFNNNHFSDFIDKGNDYSGNHLPGLPPALLTGGINIDFKKGFYAKFSGKWQQKQYLNDANTVSYTSYGLCNLKVGYRIPVASNSGLHVSFGIINLFNTHYASMVLINAPSFGGALPRYYYPGLPRNWHIGIVWKM